MLWSTRRGTQLSWAPPWQLDWSAWFFRKRPLGACLFFWSPSVLKKWYVQFQKWTLTCQRCQTRVVLFVHQHISKYWLLTCVRVRAMGFTKSNKVVKTYIVVLLILATIYVFAVRGIFEGNYLSSLHFHITLTVFPLVEDPVSILPRRHRISDSLQSESSWRHSCSSMH